MTPTDYILCQELLEQLDKMTDLTGFLYLEYEREAELFESELSQMSIPDRLNLFLVVR